jgi:hypothetical protein
MLTACCWAGLRDTLAGTKAEQRTEVEVMIFSWASVPSAGTEDETNGTMRTYSSASLVANHMLHAFFCQAIS